MRGLVAVQEDFRIVDKTLRMIAIEAALAAQHEADERVMCRFWGTMPEPLRHRARMHAVNAFDRASRAGFVDC